MFIQPKKDIEILLDITALHLIIGEGVTIAEKVLL
jgi:hypothetical protein